MVSHLSRNALSNVVQTIIGALLLFALYRYINISLGVEKLGVWAVVLSTVSVSRFVDLGLSAGVTRFVARERARGNLKQAAQVIDTSFLTMWSTVGIFLPVIYPIVKYVMPGFLEGDDLIDAINILPYALFSLWLTVGASVHLGGLSGSERMDLQAGVVITGQAVLLVLAMILVPHYGLNGLAYAQIGQALLVLSVGRVLLCQLLPPLPNLPRSWSKPVFKELLNYGAGIQGGTLAQIIFETSTRLIMARFGGAAEVGYFEMANQLVMKVRMVIVSANQAIIPYVAGMAERKSDQLHDFYRANIHLLIFFALPAFTILFSWSGLFSWMLTRSFQPQFMHFLWILCAAWFVNIFNVPAYFINMGTGKIMWNTLSHVAMAILNLIIGLMLGPYFGAFGVLIAYSVALTIGSMLVIFKFQVRIANLVPLMDKSGYCWRLNNTAIIIGCAAFIIIGLLQPIRVYDSIGAEIVLNVMFTPLVLGLLMWINPARQVIMKSIKSK